MLPSKEFLYGLRARRRTPVDLEPGVALLIGIEAVSDADERGMRTVMCTLNGQLRPVIGAGPVGLEPTSRPRRRPTAATPARSPPRSPAWSPSPCPRATRSRPARTIGTIEAMKMEAAITAPRAGSVTRVAISAGPAGRGR